MSTHAERSIDLAEKIVSFSEDALRGIDRAIVGWPAEFRAIIWEAVADVAKNRAAALKETDR